MSIRCKPRFCQERERERERERARVLAVAVVFCCFSIFLFSLLKTYLTTENPCGGSVKKLGNNQLISKTNDIKADFNNNWNNLLWVTQYWWMQAAEHCI